MENEPVSKTERLKLILNALGNLRDKESAPVIAGFLNDKDIYIQVTTINVLGLLEAAEYADQIRDKFDNDFSGIRISAGKAIKNMSGKNVKNSIPKAPEQNSPEIFPELKFEKFENQILHNFKNLSIHNKFMVLKELVRLKDPLSIEPLRDLLLEKNNLSRELRTALHTIAVSCKKNVPASDQISFLQKIP